MGDTETATIDGAFPLFELFASEPPVFCEGDEAIYNVGTNSKIDVEKLSHFALGIFWKASVASWRLNEKEPMINLGPYADGLREWSTSETAFPRHIWLSVSVSKPGQAWITLNLPIRSEFKDWRTYLMHVPGVLFILSVGRSVPTEMRMTCFHEGPGHPIFVSTDIMAKFAGFLGAHLRDSKKTMAYLKAMAKRRGA